MSDETTHSIDPNATAADPADLQSRPVVPGTSVGGYRVEGLIGQGGMGAVYRATQASPARTVALKLMRPGLASSRAMRRFELEGELLGRLAHPGIASIFEAGIHRDEQGLDVPFFAMEFVDGPTLREFAERQ